MNLPNATAAEFNPFNPFDPSAFTSLNVDVHGFTVDVEGPDGTSITCTDGALALGGGRALNVGGYVYSCSRRLSGMRRVGPFAARAHEPSVAMLYVAQRAVSVYLAALDAGLKEGSYRMILQATPAEGLPACEWRIVPSFWSLSDAALAIMDGRVASGDVESSGPETDTVRALRETGRLIAFHTHANASDADEFLCRGDDDVVVVRGLAAVHEVLTAPPFAGKIGPISATWPIVGRETAPHGPTTTIIRATDAEMAQGYVGLPDGSFATLSGHYLEGDGASDGTYTWAEVNGHYVYV